MHKQLPDSVSELLRERINSIEKLEIVSTLHSAPRSTLSLEELSRSLGVDRGHVRNIAVELRSVALVEITANEVQLLPPTNHEREQVTALVRLYREDRLPVLKALGDIAVERIRNMASQVFADALVTRKKPE